MSFSDAPTWFRDILASIDHIDAFLEGFTFDLYRVDIKTKSAVERQMQIITEASIRLRKIHAVDLCPGPDWMGFCDMGNILRHQYHRTEDEIVWNTVKIELPPMKAAIMHTLKERFPAS